MARMADSEATIWRLIHGYRSMTGKFWDASRESRYWQQVVAVLARRQAGVLVIGPRELAELPGNLTLVTSTRDDGRVVICAVEPDEPAAREPGR